MTSVSSDVQGHKRPVGGPLLPLLTLKVLRVRRSVEGVLADAKTRQLGEGNRSGSTLERGPTPQCA